MSEPKWEFSNPAAIGAVPKFIAEVRAAVTSLPADASDGSVSDADKVAALECVGDALKAFDEAAKATQEPVNG